MLGYFGILVSVCSTRTFMVYETILSPIFDYSALKVARVEMKLNEAVRSILIEENSRLEKSV